jgi:uncharacterized membrane protein
MPENQSTNETAVVNGQSSEAPVTYHAQRFSGPLPHPDILEQYDKVVPGAAERILSKFEAQTEHRIKIEGQVVFTSNLKEILGLTAAFVITLVALVGGIYTALQGKPLLGGSLSFAGLAMIVGAFIAGRIVGKEKNDD